MDDKIIIAVTVKDAFNGQVVKLNMTEEVWEKLMIQIETSRAQRRKELKLKPNG